MNVQWVQLLVCWDRSTNPHLHINSIWLATETITRLCLRNDSQISNLVSLTGQSRPVACRRFGEIAKRLWLSTASQRQSRWTVYYFNRTAVRVCCVQTEQQC